MALLDNITYSPGEPMQAAFDKMNAAIDQINAVLGGGLSDQILKKTSDSDFDTFWDDSEIPDQSGQSGKNIGTNGISTVWEYVKTISDGSNQFKFKILDIGDWDMSSSSTKTVAHVLDWTKIVSVQAIIVNDANTKRYVFTQRGESGMESSGIQEVDPTNINLYRTNSGVGGSTNFNSAAFDSTGYNRGKILITYLA